MGKIYTFYAKIPQDLFDTTYKYILSNTSSSASYQIIDGMVYILYAWTKNKEYAKEFKEVRPSNVFTMKIYHSDDIEDIDRFALTKETCLGLNNFIKYTDDEVTRISILTTTDECKVIKSEFIECFEEHFIGELLSGDIPPSVFKEDIVKSLAVVGYTQKYYGYYGTDDECDMASYYLSYGLSPEGLPMLVDRYDKLNEVEALLFIFKYFFYEG